MIPWPAPHTFRTRWGWRCVSTRYDLGTVWGLTPQHVRRRFWRRWKRYQRHLEGV
jgi:hypothetical protein